MSPHADENVYDSLAEAAGGEQRWAFGTGFTDALAGVDTAVPEHVDAPQLARQCLALGDDALVLAQRLGLWVSNAPDLEEELALANIALDLLGQARLLLTRAARADPALRPASAPAQLPDEDALAYWRDAPEFTSTRLAELDDAGDFARCVARLFVVVSARLAVMSRLTTAPDPVLAAIAAKAVPELAYHREYAAGWVVRLGDGTELSHRRMQQAIDWVWPHLPAELDPGDAHAEFDRTLDTVLAAATLARPAPGGRPEPADRDERVALLADLQLVARADPEATW